MAQESWSGVCLDGPWRGEFVSRTTRAPVRGGVFNLVGLAGIRGSYAYDLILRGWLWGEWVDG